MYGDSTTAGLEFIDGKYINTVNSVPSDLWQLLDHALGETVTVVAAGHTGATVRDVLDGTNGFTVPFAQAVLTDKGQVIDVNFAINDYNQYSVEEFRQYLTTFVVLAQSAGKTVVIEEPNPQCNKTTGQEVVSASPGTSPMVPVIDQIGVSLNAPVVHQYSAILAIPGWCSMLTDGTHPNDALYQIKAQNSANVLIPIVKGLQ